MSTAVAFDFAEVVPTVRRAHSRASVEDAEDAVQTAVVELLAKGTDLTAPNVVTRARSRLINRFKRREAGNVSLDGLGEADEDHAPREVAIEEVDFEAHVEVAMARENPVLRGRMSSGGYFTGWTRELILEALRIVTREDGKCPRAEALKTDPRLPCITVFYRRFGTWEEAVEAAGIEYTPQAWDREKAVETLRDWTDRHGRLPNSDDLRNAGDIGLPGQSACYRLFGSVSQPRLGAVIWGEDAGRILAAIAILRQRGPGQSLDLAAQLAEFVGG